MQSDGPDHTQLLLHRHATRRFGVDALDAMVRSHEGPVKREAAAGHHEDVELRVLEVGSLAFAYLRSEVPQRVAVRRGRQAPYLLHFVLDGHVAYRIDGVDLHLSAGDGVAVNPSSVAERHGGPSTILSVRLDARAVRQRLLRMIPRGRLDAPVFSPRMGGAHGSLLAMACLLDRCFATGVAVPGDPISDALEAAFLDLLLDLQPHSHSESIAHHESRSKARLVDRMQALVDGHPADSFTIDDLAAKAGCSVRSLQLACLELHGVAPTEFVRHRRLALAREALVRSGGNATASGVAAQFGFGSPSAFSHAYRAAFGETPGATIAAARKRDGKG